MRFSSLVVIMVLGCASKPPSELVSARQSYERARTGAAAQLSPNELSRSRVLLAEAEQKYADSPSSRRVRDLAYAAERQAQRAEVLANAELAKQDKARAEADLMAAQGEIERRAAHSEERAVAERIARNQAEARATREAADAAAAKARADSEEAARSDAEQRLANAAEARMAADRSRAAVDSLTRLGAYHEEARGTVISFDAGALFAVDGATLLPGASDRLATVADVIKPEQVVIIDCPGDPTGSEAYRQWLAQKRTAAVRDALIARGVPAAHIRVAAVRTSSPNVEIILQR